MSEQVESASVRITLTADGDQLAIGITFLNGDQAIQDYLSGFSSVMMLTIHPTESSSMQTWPHIEMWHTHPTGGAGFIWLTPAQMICVPQLHQQSFEARAFKQPGPGFLFVALPNSLETL